MDNNSQFDIKSPIFTPHPGWGGKTKKWLQRHFMTKIFPIISLAVLALGIYLVFSR